MKSDNTKRIDSYLSGEMSAEEKIKFEQELKDNDVLREELETQKNVQNAAGRAGIRKTVKSVGKRYHRINLSKWIFGGAAIVAIALASIYFVTKEDKNEHPSEKTELMEESLELEKDELIKELPREIFAWEGKDTVYTSENGVLISVPDEALLLNGKPYKGNAIVEWQEAMDGATIMKSGLSTMADSNLLETQGMFSFRIQTQDGKLLEVDPEVGIYAQVPVDEVKPGMQLYEGVYDKDSIINWVDPRPLEKLPVPVDMSELNFYPVGYEDTLDQLKLSQLKKYRDSLYLACEFEEENGEDIEFVEYEEGSFPKRTITIRERDLIYGDNRPIDNLMTWQEAIKIKQAGNPENDPFIESIEISSSQMTDSVSYGRSEMIETSLEYAYIPPSKVLAFWKDKFNNTILATHEFEKRMRIIHETCDESLLDLYVNNIDQPLYYVDSLVMIRGYSQFERFYAERVGGISIESPHLKNLKKFYDRGVDKLQEEIRKQKEEFKKSKVVMSNKLIKERVAQSIRARSANNKLMREETDFNLKRKPIRNSVPSNAAAISSSAITVAQQRTRSIGFRMTGNNSICNVDRRVAAATRSRQNFKGRYMGKTIDLKYNNFKISVEDAGRYNKLFAYLLPDKFNSYQRLSGKAGEFTYRLNDKVKYTVVLVGFNQDEFYYHEEENVRGGSFENRNLKNIDEATFKNNIASINQKRLGQISGLMKDLNWLKLERDYYKLTKELIEKERLLKRMRKVVFPCLPVDTQGNQPEVQEANSLVQTLEVLEYPDVEAQFVNGDIASFIRNAIQYPDLAIEQGLGGKVYIQFTVEKDGSVSNPRILRGVHPLLDNEAIRIVKTLPNFDPALSNGQRVKSLKSIPINFVLN